MSKTILNVAAGKFNPIGIEDADYASFLINLDTMYYQSDPVDAVEGEWDNWIETIDKRFHCNEDAFTFMERTRIMFDKICIYRFLEHVSFTQVQYFIYLLSTITEPGAWVDVIVPNYEVLAKMILEESVHDIDYEAKNIELTTELLNEPSCPHASIWTPARAMHYFELENRFKVGDLINEYTFDGRSIYLRFWAERI